MYGREQVSRGTTIDLEHTISQSRIEGHRITGGEAQNHSSTCLNCLKRTSKQTDYIFLLSCRGQRANRQQPQNVDWQAVARDDMKNERPKWPFTCYSHIRDGNNDLTGDFSFEEV